MNEIADVIREIYEEVKGKSTKDLIEELGLKDDRLFMRASTAIMSTIATGEIVVRNALIGMIAEKRLGRKKPLEPIEHLLISLLAVTKNLENTIRTAYAVAVSRQGN